MTALSRVFVCGFIETQVPALRVGKVSAEPSFLLCVPAFRERRLCMIAETCVESDGLKDWKSCTTHFWSCMIMAFVGAGVFTTSTILAGRTFCDAILLCIILDTRFSTYREQLTDVICVVSGIQHRHGIPGALSQFPYSMLPELITVPKASLSSASAVFTRSSALTPGMSRSPTASSASRTS